MRLLCLRALLLPILLLSVTALAQTSQKAIRIIVPFAPGASADGIARAIGNDLGARSGKAVIVENNGEAAARSALRRWRSRRPTATRSGSARRARC